MDEPIRSLAPGDSGAGSVNVVTRVGDTIHRPAGPWTPAVHGLLEHLEPFPFSPRALSREPTAEVLEYIEGEVAMRPWPSQLLTLQGLEGVARMLAALHEAVESYVPADGAVWRVPGATHVAGQIVRHGDLGPWNMVWREERLVGLIDWDFAEPGTRAQDIAQLAWYCCPLHGAVKTAQAGVPEAAKRARFERLCAVFGAAPSEVLRDVLALQDLEVERMLSLEGEPWRGFAARGDIEEIRQDQFWLRGWGASS